MTDLLAPWQARIDAQLTTSLDVDSVAPSLLEVMRYGVFNGGKRVRPALVYMATEALGTPLEQADSTACAVELIHAYSLIHDDLPSMDDDDLRRGKPTCHIQFNEAMAILAGDALQTLAFQLVAEDASLPEATRLAIVSRLGRAAGPAGMVAGQVIDIESENLRISDDQLVRMHHHKTGALISASVACGALIGGADDNLVRDMEAFGFALGLAFQVRDDILDSIGTTEALGKTQGADDARNKSTFVSLHGLDAAQQQLEDLRAEALALLSPLGDKAVPLRALTDFVADRHF